MDAAEEAVTHQDRFSASTSSVLARMSRNVGDKFPGLTMTIVCTVRGDQGVEDSIRFEGHPRSNT
jgi:hypothetical protein